MNLPVSGPVESVQRPWNSFGKSDGWLNLVHLFGKIELAQTYSALYWLNRCFEEHLDIGCALELGTLYGGLSAFLGLSFPGRVITCDHTDKRKDHAKYLHERLGVHFEFVNVLNPEAPKQLLELCQQRIGYSPESKIFLFCDNGGKETEFRLFAPHLRRGDLIAVHDYGTEFDPNRPEIVNMVKKLRLEPWREAEMVADGAYIGIWKVPEKEKQMNESTVTKGVDPGCVSTQECALDIKVVQESEEAQLRAQIAAAQARLAQIGDLGLGTSDIVPACEPMLRGRPRYRFHVQGMPHTATGDPAFHHCAFTSNIKNFCKMMKSLGHIVIHYGGEGSVPECDEHVTIVSKKERDEWFHADWTRTQSDVVYDCTKPYWQVFNQRTIEAMGARLRPKDFICLVSGANKPVADAFPGFQAVEFGIGYSGCFAQYRCFPSYAWMHWIYGARKEEDGRWMTDVVIPHYLDPEELPFDAEAREKARRQDNKDFLYLGRALVRKGAAVAADVVSRIKGGKLFLAGQGFEQVGTSDGHRKIVSNIPSERNLAINGSHATIVGAVGPKRRAELLANCKALLCPTIYIGPFELVHAEGQMCGTPAICTDWGAFVDGVVDGVTGFRVRTLAEAIYACEHAGDLDPLAIREHAMKRWSLASVALQYQRWFDRLYSLWTPGPEGGWYSPGLVDRCS